MFDEDLYPTIIASKHMSTHVTLQWHVDTTQMAHAPRFTLARIAKISHLSHILHISPIITDSLLCIELTVLVDGVRTQASRLKFNLCGCARRERSQEP